MGSREVEVVKLNLKAHYGLVSLWWQQQPEWQPVPKSWLPEDTGFMAYYHGTPVAATWLYLTNSKCAVLEWTIADPKSAMKQRAACLDALLDTVQEFSVTQGIEMIYTNTKHTKWIERLQSHGYNLTEGGMSNLILM